MMALLYFYIPFTRQLKLVSANHASKTELELLHLAMLTQYNYSQKSLQQYDTGYEHNVLDL